MRMNSSTMHAVPGFMAEHPLLADQTHLLLRAERDGRSFLLRLPREAHRRPEQDARVRYGFELGASLDLPGIVRPVELTRNGNGLVLVMEDFGGAPLRARLSEGALPVPEALRITRRLAEVLGQLHLRRILYKSLNPSNVLVNARTGEVRICNFELASRLTSETPGFSSGELRGELAYVSPEQTGRMNRSVDYRSDLYSLGATLYEMLTGRPPFQGGDALSLVYSHLAVAPVPPDQLRAEIPAALSAVVVKLLAKNAEDRYQSAYGLSADLEECLRQWEATGTIADLKPGQRDVPAILHLPRKLYGREREAAELTAAFERVSAGNRAELLLVSGYSGVGKTSLVHELHRSITQKAGTYTAGKFDTLQRTPYSAWIQAFDSLFRQMLAQDESQVARWRRVLQEALGPNARVITDVIPRLELVIGPQPAVPELDAAESRNRFHLTFQRLVEAVADREHPLVLLLDDLQWADAASLGLLQFLLADIGPRHLLVIGAYRDNEVRAGHPLLAVLDEIRKASGPVSGIALRPLPLESVQQLLGDAVARPGDAEVAELASLVFQKTQGNPFFMGQFITALQARGLLTLEPGRGRWGWSLERIRSEAITDNVATLMVERLQQLSPTTQEVLKRAACIGNQFTLETLSVISERSARETAADLWEALQQGLLLPIGENYKYVPQEANGAPSTPPSEVRFEFLHDRVQEAAYSLMSADSSKVLHLRIGRLLLQSTPAEQREEMIFDIVHQLNRALELLDDRLERLELAQLNLVAGLRAKHSSAYTDALGYLQVGTSLLGEDCWESAYELTYPLHLHRSECLSLLGRTDEASRDFELILSRARSPHEKGEIYLLMIGLYFSQGRYMEAVQPARDGFKVLGLDLPDDPAENAAAIAREREKWEAVLAKRPIASLVDLPEAKDPVERTRIKLLSRSLATVGYLYPSLLHLGALVMANRAQEHGHAPGSGFGYGAMVTTMMGNAEQHATALELSKLSIALSERYDPRRGELPLNQFMFAAFIAPWCQPFTSTLPMLKQTLHSNMDVGLFIWAGLSSKQIGVLAQLGGEDLDTQLHRMQWHLDFHLGGGAQWAETVRHVGMTINAILRLKHGALPANAPPYFEIPHLVRNMHNVSVLGFAHTLWLRVSYLLREADLAEMLEKTTTHMAKVHAHVIQAEFFLYQGLAMAALHAEASAEERARQEQVIAANVETLRRYSAGCAVNFLQKHLLLAAEQARLAGRELDAMALYDQAIAAAVKAGHPHEEALANELAARFHLAHGRTRLVRSYLEDARAAYARWGARAKVEQLEREFPRELPHAAGPEAKATSSDPRELDLATVLKASQALSEEIVFAELIQKLMSIILENAGARRALLLLGGDNPLVVEARQEGHGSPVIQLHAGKPESFADLPQMLVRYVERTGEQVVLREISSEGPFQADPYVVRQRPRSVLCMRIVKQKQSLGTLYLENNLVDGAFTPDRCKVLELLSVQAAISLENARLYDTLDQRVRERTRELNTRNEELFRTLEQLKQAQVQLVTQEKLASLGAVVSGIAHEIKNPLNFINNFAALSVDLTRELNDLLETERMKMERRLVEEMRELATTLRDNASRIEEHGKRADTIVRSMLELTHRGGNAELSEVNLNQLVDQFAKLAYEGFRTQLPAFSASLVTRFDQSLRPVPVIQQDLGRVILNLVNNSCYALEAKRQATGGHFNPELQMSTRELGNEVEIRIRDNGMGIPEPTRAQIFNPFFTTKPPGQGTGLGLSISHEIVVQEHGGRIEVASEEGQFTEFVITLPRQLPQGPRGK